MARQRKKRSPADAPLGPTSSATNGLTPGVSTAPLATAGAAATAVVALLSLMMLLAPATGVPSEEMLQDTLKSIIVSFMALAAGVLLLWRRRTSSQPMLWHAVLLLPLALMAYALGSMAWSHTYLGAVEAIRWFIFSLLLWVGLNALHRDQLPLLAWGVHTGAVVASLWTALQFWIDLSWFPQGPNPASTFVNRNFFAEFAVCTLPFTAMLLARARLRAQMAWLCISGGLVIVAILMTGTRAALMAMWLQLLLVLPLVAWRWREQFAMAQWSRATRWLVGLLLLATVLVLGAIPSGNTKIVEEGRGTSALERGLTRTASISANDPSLGIRMIMWRATLRVIEQRPFTGVGAGAWESEIPLYQDAGSQLETDYYVHNEFLQLLAEYGVVGWLFLLALAGWLIDAFVRTWRASTPQERAEAPWRAVLLCSLLALFVVSNVGFPWRMASTGALFALCLAGLAASDARLGRMGRWATALVPWRPTHSRAGLGGLLVCLALAVFIAVQAYEAERKIVRATKIALTISASGEPNHPRWDQRKAQMLALIREGIRINPHYRKITPMVGDELARWGDWRNATWIWESVLASRPHVVALLTNAARGHIAMGETAQAMALLERAKKLQPRAPAVRSLEIILLARAGQTARALQLARQAISDNIYDHDLANAAFVLASRAGDYAFADQAMQLRSKVSPASRVLGLIQVGRMYAGVGADPDKAVAAFQQALAATSNEERQMVINQIPPDYRLRLGLPPAGALPAPKPQMSASKG